MKSFKLIIIAVASLMLTAYANAQPVSREAAADVARHFWTSGGGGRRLAPSKASPTLSYTASTSDEVQFYVFNNAAGSGFVVVGGDQRVPSILGYSNSGAFDYNRAPENLKWWLSQYSEQIHQTVAQASAAPRKNVVAKGADITPLVSTTWDQSNPYNSALPSLGAGYTGQYALATGCVATAMAQIMNYHQYPVVGIDSHTDINAITVGETTVKFEADFGSTHYDWSNMLDSYKSSFTALQSNAVAQLMYHCGVAVDMKYGQFSTGGSEADTRDVTPALVKYFGYDRGISYIMRDYMTADEWETTIYNELKALRPVLYGGQSVVPGSQGGHAFVCDGYRAADNTFHINWGWGGYCDGYFLLNGSGALKPSGSGSGGAGENAEYVTRQVAVIGIRPDAGNPVNENLWVGEFTALSSNVASGTDLPVTITIENMSCTKLTFQIGMKFTNTATNEEIIKPFSQKFNIEPKYYAAINAESAGTKYLNIPTNYIGEGEYTVTPVFLNQQGNWQDLHMATGLAQQTVNISAPTDDLYLVSEPSFGNKYNNEFYITPDEHSTVLKIKNNTAADIKTNIVVFFMFNEGGGSSYSSVDYILLMNVTLPAGEVTELPANKLQNNKLEAGKRYMVAVQDNKSGKYLVSNLWANVVDPVTIPYTLSELEWGTICLPFEAEVPAGITAYAVSSYSGTSLKYTEVSHLNINTPYILHGTPGDYVFKGPGTPAGTYTSGLLTGTTADDQKLPYGSYILQNQTSGFGFYQVDIDRMAAQYRAYLNLPVGATSPYFIFDAGETTAINAIEGSKTVSDQSIYNLNGQRISTPQRGINIIGGKKVLVK